MKTRKQFLGLIAMAIITIAIIGCKGDETHTHQWGEWIVTKEATTTEEGEETRTCATCEEKETRPIAKLPEQPKDQTATITFSFKKQNATDTDPFITATVTGYLTDTEWNGVANKIKTAIENEYKSVPMLFKNVLGEMGPITIIVEKTDSYSSYSTTTSEKIIRINFAILNNASSLETALSNASKAILGVPEIPSSANVTST